MRSMPRLLTVLVIGMVTVSAFQTSFGQTQPSQTAPADEGRQIQFAEGKLATPTDLPGWAQEVTLAWIDAQNAWDRLQRAEQALRQARIQARHRALTAPELRQARQRLTEARLNYTKARSAVRERLRDNPDYKAALARRNALDQDLEAARQRGDMNAVVNLAEQKLGPGTRASQIEAEAMRNDQGVQQAWDRLTAASEQLKTVQQQVRTAVQEDPLLESLMKEIGQAQEAYAWAARRLAAAEAGYEQAQADRALLLNRFYGVYYLYGEPGWTSWSY